MAQRLTGQRVDMWHCEFPKWGRFPWGSTLGAWVGSTWCTVGAREGSSGGRVRQAGSSPRNEVKPLLDSRVLVQCIKSNSSPSPAWSGEAAVDSAVVFGGRHYVHVKGRLFQRHTPDCAPCLPGGEDWNVLLAGQCPGLFLSAVPGRICAKSTQSTFPWALEYLPQPARSSRHLRGRVEVSLGLFAGQRP